MRKQYDFSQGKRGPVQPIAKSKTRVTIRLDEDLLAWFMNEVHQAGGGSYQSLINAALREHVHRAAEPLEEMLRRVPREELKRVSEARRLYLTTSAKHPATSLPRGSSPRSEMRRDLRTQPPQPAYRNGLRFEGLNVCAEVILRNPGRDLSRSERFFKADGHHAKDVQASLSLESQADWTLCVDYPPGFVLENYEVERIKPAA